MFYFRVGEQHDAEEEERHANGAAGTGHANGAAGTGYSRLQEESVEPSSHEDVPMSIRVSGIRDSLADGGLLGLIVTHL